MSPSWKHSPTPHRTVLHQDGATLSGWSSLATNKRDAHGCTRLHISPHVRVQGSTALGFHDQQHLFKSNRLFTYLHSEISRQLCFKSTNPEIKPVGTFSIIQLILGESPTGLKSGVSLDGGRGGAEAWDIRDTI